MICLISQVFFFLPHDLDFISGGKRGKTYRRIKRAYNQNEGQRSFTHFILMKGHLTMPSRAYDKIPLQLQKQHIF